MIRYFTSLAAICLLLPLFSAEKPEISWSVMHPRFVSVDYMKRVVEKADEYGGVDSFEVCGDCHSPCGGINGLSMLEPYPNAHAKIDPKAVEKARRELNAVIDIAHRSGRPVYYWHREIFIPDGLLKDLPKLLDEDGEFDLLGKTYQDYLRFKIDETFKYAPGLDGIALTLTEADFSVIHNSNPKRYPPPKVVETLVGLFAEEHARRGKRFILRSFGSIRKDYEDIIAGAKAAAARHSFEIETKVTEADFVPWLPKNPFLVKNPPLTLGSECDALGEYLGVGYLPASQVERIREYVAYSREEDTDRYTIRIDRTGNSIFDSAHEINLMAYMHFIKNPSATADDVYALYNRKRYGAAADEMTAIGKTELEMVRNIHYVASNLVFHSFPPGKNMKILKACGIFGVYRENSDLSMGAGSWSILHWQKTPTHKRILAEKKRGLEAAEAGLGRIRRLKDKIPSAEYARLERAWLTAVTAATTMKAFTECITAYFEDMADGLDRPRRLEAAVMNAEKVITSVAATETAEIRRVYCDGLLHACRSFEDEYRAERRMRKELSGRGEVADFVVVGGIYDDGRVLRAMHGAHARLHDGVVMRQAGNPVFPNGTITVKFKDIPGASVEVKLDPSGAQGYNMTERVDGSVRTVTIGKKGVDYPVIRSIALVRK